LDNFYLKVHEKLGQQTRRMNAAVERSAQAYEQRYVASRTLRGKLGTDGQCQ